jgi:flagellar motor switch protein FliM
LEKALNQQEIDAMVQAAAQQSLQNEKKDQRSITPFGFRQSGQLNGQQTHLLTALHEAFARDLTQSLGAYLRIPFEANVLSVEQLTYGDFLTRSPEVTYMESFAVRQASAVVGMRMDRSVFFPLIDVLLGGNGRCEVLTREISEIEEQIMEGVGRTIFRELASTWSPLGVEIELEGRQQAAQVQRFLAAAEKIFCITFEIKLAETQGNLTLILPVSVSNTLLRKLSADRSYARPRINNQSSARLRDKMLDCPFPITLGISPIALPVRKLTELAAEMICDLGIPVRNSGSLILAGRQVFSATAVRRGHKRAAQVGEPISAPAKERRQ